MPQLSPMHWLYMLLFCWFVLMNLFSMVWWINYSSYLKFDYLKIIFSNFNWYDINMMSMYSFQE